GDYRRRRMGFAASQPSCSIHTIVIQNLSEAHAIVILNLSESSWRCDRHHSAAALADTSVLVQARTLRSRRMQSRTIIPNMERCHEDGFVCPRLGRPDCGSNAHLARERGADVPGEFVLRV